MHYRFVALEGNIGAGKTTLCKRLASELKARIVLEEFSNNPFLPLFYQDPSRYAFPVELFFLAERYQQWKQLSSDLFVPCVVSDYHFLKSVLFASTNLGEEEFKLFRRLASILHASLVEPDLIIYLHLPPEQLLRNIAQRGRPYEQSITATYLMRLQQAYFTFFKTVRHVPVLVITPHARDYLTDHNFCARLVELLAQKHPKGVTHLSF